MKFLTQMDIMPASVKIDYRSRILSFGSCFSENIGYRLQRAMFQIDTNPFGVLFNPASIAQNIEILSENKNFSENHLSKRNSFFFNFAFDTSFSATTAERCLEKINARFVPAVENLKNADFLLITLGTAFVFELRQTGEIVANCHKLPAENFTRRRLSVDEIILIFEKLFSKLKIINPKLHIILTVSPVRHTKDGLHENNLSKSILLLSAEKLEKIFENVSYFPAYEIVLDELRDYRFYAPDLLHPSETAIDYVWEKFAATYFSAQTQKTVNLAEKFTADCEHIPLHPESVEFANFLKIKDKRKFELEKIIGRKIV
ncbi:MAG: GSCFA domain-containing protein [Prevotellaceae bacterium]|jgi:hypothetical protein|nr:GSCFA domain-containing protein [Prevotellaceae bacterium]